MALDQKGKYRLHRAFILYTNIPSDQRSKEFSGQVSRYAAKVWKRTMNFSDIRKVLSNTTLNMLEKRCNYLP